MNKTQKVWWGFTKNILLWLLSIGLVSGITYGAGTVITSYTQNVAEWDIIWAAYYNSLNTLLGGTKSEWKFCKYLWGKMVCVDDMPTGWQQWSEVDPIWAAEKDFKANIDSPDFTWDPTAPMPNDGDNDNSLATTAWVKANTTSATTSSSWWGWWSCYYTTSNNCANGYSQVSGTYSPYSWGAHNICCPWIVAWRTDFTYNGANYQVMPSWCQDVTNNPSCSWTDTLQKTWQNAKTFCDNLIVEWNSDWFLPSAQEAKAMYAQKATIWWFTTSKYWSSNTFYLYNLGETVNVYSSIPAMNAHYMDFNSGKATIMGYYYEDITNPNPNGWWIEESNYNYATDTQNPNPYIPLIKVNNILQIDSTWTSQSTSHYFRCVRK